MKYIDCQSDKILLDSDLNIDKLGWKNGDHFKVTNINGQAMLIKVDPITAFTNGYAINTNNRST